MFAVALGDGLLQTPVEADDVAGDVAQLVVGEGAHAVERLVAAGPFGKLAEPQDAVTQPAGGQEAGGAHEQRDPQHEPQEAAVGAQHAREGDRMGQRGAHDASVGKTERGIEIGGAEAFG